MKQVTLTRTLFIAFFLVLVGCSRDTSLPLPGYAKSTVLPSEFPVPNNGAIKGFVTPVPSIANFKVYNEEEGYSSAGKVNSDGSFMMENIPQGVYTLNITYLIVRAEYSYYASHEIDRIVVRGGEMNSLGEIQLPWTY